MNGLFFLLDVSPGPVQSTGWGVIALLLIIIFAFSVAFSAGLVVLLIWLKRRKQSSSAYINPNQS